MITVVCVSALTVFAYVSITSRLGLLPLCIGHNAVVDILFTVLVSGMALMTGSLMGLLISVVTGFIITVVLIVMRKYMDYQLIVRKTKPNGKKAWFRFEIQEFKAEKPLPKLLQPLASKVA